MGKGQRAREARAGKKEELKKIAAKQKLRSKIYKVAGICAAALAAVAVVGVVAYNTVASTGYFLRNTVAMKTTDCEIDNAMMTYYLKNQYYNFANQNADYLTMYGLDTQKSLKSQKYGDGTWFDYFLDLAKNQARETILCAQKSMENGYTLTDADKKEIDDSIASFEKEAKSYGMSITNYYSQVFGAGVKENDVRRAMELTKYATAYYDEFVNSLEFTDNDLQDHFNKNESSYLKADYIKYTVPGADEVEKKANAKELMDTKTTEELLAMLEKKYTDEATNTAISDNIDEGKSEEDAKNLTDEQKTKIKESVESSMAALEYTSYMPENPSENQDLEWVFGNERKVGDKNLYEIEATESTSYSCSIFVVLKTKYFDDYNVQKVRHIMFTESENETKDGAKAKAEEVLKEYKADAKEDKFIELAKKYSEDASTAENGGLYEQVTKETGNWPENFTKWAYDENRKAGDVEIIETDSGWHIMYYVGQGDLLWKESAKAALKTEKYEAQLSSLENTYKLEKNENKMASIKA